MSGFEVFAAAIGVAELTLRSISSAYEFTRYIKDAPKLVQKLQRELHELTKYLTELNSLSATESPARPAIERLGLSTTVERCSAACHSLETNLRKWTDGGPGTLTSRLRVRVYKSRIESATNNIAKTKQDLHSAVSLVTLVAVSSQSDMSGRNLKEATTQKESGVEDLLSSSATHDSGKQLITRSPSAMATTKVPPQSTSTNAEPESQQGSAQDGRRPPPGRQEGYDTEVHKQSGNEVTNVQRTKLGAPAYMSIREFTMENNKVADSSDTNIGRW